MQPATSLVHNDVQIRKQPPIIVDYCVPPSSGKTEAECGYQATTCLGQSTHCPRCYFPYCEKHYPKHRRTLQAPPDAWGSIIRRLRASMDVAATKTKAGRQNKISVGKITVKVEES